MNKLLSSFPNAVKANQEYSSVIFPSCEDTNIDQFRTLDVNMIMVNHVFARSGNFSLWNALEAFGSSTSGSRFFEWAKRFARYRDFPYFLYNNHDDGITYRVDPVSGEQRPLGRTVHTDKDPDPEGDAFVISYRYARQIGHTPLMLLGYIASTHPGLGDCRVLSVPIEEVLARRDAAKQDDEKAEYTPQLVIRKGPKKLPILTLRAERTDKH